MKLKTLIKNLKYTKIIGSTELEIKDLAASSTLVTDGALFIALCGNTFDGNSFIRQAELYGAKAVITEKELTTTLTQIIVPNARKAMSFVSAEFYGRPSEKMKIIGVTGTNGKTTTTYIIKSILDSAGIKCGVIGTLGIVYDKVYVEPSLTTPDPIALHKTLAEMYKKGVKVVVMEVSAHALYYDKTNDVSFEVGVLTNFTQDHLDFFGNMEDYKKAKKKFFEKDRCKFKVVNSDDALGVELLSEDNKIISYGIENPSDVFAIDLVSDDFGSEFVLNLFDVIYDVDLSLIGNFNVYNAMAGATATALIGVPTEKIIRGLCSIKTVSGRLELVYKADFSVYIDYAHTPDGLEKTLSALKGICRGRLICVFGCGGNRDKEKRPLMGSISGKYADFTVITSDNPRFEEPMDVISSIEEGLLKETRNYVVVQERAEGIKYALDYAKKGDVVLIAGKGSEKYQEILGIKHVYNDKDTVKELVKGKNRC